LYEITAVSVFITETSYSACFLLETD